LKKREKIKSKIKLNDKIKKTDQRPASTFINFLLVFLESDVQPFKYPDTVNKWIDAQ